MTAPVAALAVAARRRIAGARSGEDDRAPSPRPYDDRVSVRADRRQIPWATLVVMALAGAAAWWATGASWVAILVAVVAGWLILRAGFAVLSSLATPLPPPPPAGELRKVRLVYRCSLCGTEVRMTSANDEVPEPPRHCMEDMDLVTSLDDI
jgi:hypothetical protein